MTKCTLKILQCEKLQHFYSMFGHFTTLYMKGLNDKCDFLEYICNFADDTAPFICDKNLDVVLEQLEQERSIVLSWFENNNKKICFGKCHLTLSVNKCKHSCMLK